MMAQFTVNPNRLDPYKGFKFRVLWDNQVIAGVSRVTGLRRRTEVVEHREGGDPSTVHKSPGITRFEPITLERGVTHDTAFEAWAKKAGSFSTNPALGVSLADFRKDMVIELFNEANQLVLRYQVFRCWVSAYQALPELDANGSAVAIETIVVENEGWERDAAVVEPAEPSCGS